MGFTAFSIYYNGLANRIITEVHITKAFDLKEIANGKLPYEPLKTTGLWDTGATGSVVTPRTVKELGLIPVKTVEVNHGGGRSTCNAYIVNIFLPNRVIIPGVFVTEPKEILDSFGVIIGMDLITKGDFSITNFENKTCMSYRIPSIQKIDYAKEAEKLKFRGTGRNDPCPCGKKDEAGKPIKYKHCHGS